MYNEKGYFIGHTFPEEHRTVGPVRAWCSAAREWCYPKDPCYLCAETMRTKEN